MSGSASDGTEAHHQEVVVMCTEAEHTFKRLGAELKAGISFRFFALASSTSTIGASTSRSPIPSSGKKSSHPNPSSATPVVMVADLDLMGVVALELWRIVDMRSGWGAV